MYKKRYTVVVAIIVAYFIHTYNNLKYGAYEVPELLSQSYIPQLLGWSYIPEVLSSSYSVRCRK